MATSFVLNKTVGDIVAEALRDARIIASEQPVQDVDYQKGRVATNNVIKHWQTQGVHLWRIKRAVLPLVPNQQSYSLGPTGAPCGEYETFYQTTLDADEATGQTVLSVASTDNMAAASQIGIQLDDGTMQWTDIVSVDTGAGTVTVTDALTGDAASGNTVFHYVTQIQRPLSLFNQTYANSFTESEIPVDIWSRSEYMEQPLKNSNGTVTGAHYTPYTTLGTLYVWQTANAVTNIMRFDYREPLLVYGAVNDQLGIPEEYYQALKWALAADLGPQYGVKPERQMILESKAVQALEMSLDNDAEEGSMYIAPDFDGGVGG